MYYSTSKFCMRPYHLLRENIDCVQIKTYFVNQFREKIIKGKEIVDFLEYYV